MRKRILYGLAIVLLVVSVLLVVWQGSFHLGRFSPEGAQQALIYLATLVLIFILIVVLAFNLAREFLKLYIARQANEEGSRIRTKLVVGALTLSIVPVFFLVFFSYEVFSFNVNKWLTEPAEGRKELFVDLAKALKQEVQHQAASQAALLALQAETRRLIEDGDRSPGFLERFAKEQGLDSAAVYSPSGGVPLDSWQSPPTGKPRGQAFDPVESSAPVPGSSGMIGVVVVRSSMPLDVAGGVAQIDQQTKYWNELSAHGKELRKNLVLLMALITLFVIFVATWIALFLAKQISVPITALLEAAREVRKGNLKHRVEVQAADELGLLVRGFNQMTQEMEANAHETRPPPPLYRSHPGKHSHGRHFHFFRRLHQARQSPASEDLSRRCAGARLAPGRPVLARRHRRNQVPHEARAPHRRGHTAARAAYRGPRAPDRRHRIRA